MPHPPVSAVVTLLNELTESIKEERGTAELRHKEILSKLCDYQKVFREHSSGIISVDPKCGNGRCELVPTSFCQDTTKKVSESLLANPGPGKASGSILSHDIPDTPTTIPGNGKASGSILSLPDTPSSQTKNGQSLLSLLENADTPKISAIDGAFSVSTFDNDSPARRASAASTKQSKSNFGRKSKIKIRRRASDMWGSESMENAWLGIFWLQRIVKDEKFEIFVAFMILLNAFFLCFEVQYQSIDIGYDLQFPKSTIPGSTAWPSADSVFGVADWCFGILFAVEAILKMLILRSRYFRDGWSYLDLMCVVAFSLDKIAAPVVPVDGKGLRLLRLMRLARLVRLLRFLESLDELYIMTTAFLGMVRIVVWAVVLLTIMLMTCALLLTQILHTTYFNDVNANNLTPLQVEKHQELYKYFGSLTRCMLTMFELTLANWPTATRILSEEVSEWFMLLCVIHKLTIGFAVIAVINGVILQETFKVASTDDLIMVRQKRRAVESTRTKMMNLFEALDSSKAGNLSLTDFQTISEVPEVKIWLSSMDIETDDLSTLFKLIDDDDSGNITVDEFVRRIPRIKGAARSIDVMALNQRLNLVFSILRAQEEKQEEFFESVKSANHEELVKEVFADAMKETQTQLNGYHITTDSMGSSVETYHKSSLDASRESSDKRAASLKTAMKSMF